ncbi:hypothetical protein [Thermoflexus sp.]|uniref:hypothetical protein n=1 Tax=Thermoflexus sp. TaxID=1969742 RepID=UPI0035E461AE
MRRPGLSVMFAALAAGLSLIAGLGIWSVLNRSAPAARPESVAGRPAHPTIEALKAELERATQEELAKGCVERDSKTGQPVLCGSSKARVEAIHARLVEETLKAEQREPEAVARVIARIRALREDPSLEVFFQGTSANPYLDASRRVEIYQDNRGMMYFVDPTTDEVFQFGPGPNSEVEFCLRSQLGVDELRQRAESFLSKNIPGFQQIQENWTYSESAKGGTSFIFRWEAPGASAGEEIQPVVQVVLSLCGEIRSFLNTSSLGR